MQITKEMLKEKGACPAGYMDFCETFPDGTEYQALLDYCCEHDRADYAHWLLSKFGATDDVREIDGDYITDKSIVFAGSIKVKGSVRADGFIEAGRDIEAGWHIEAGEDIKAGWDIEAGYGIKAGKDYGIYAGLSVPITSRNRTIRAVQKPTNIMCGEWVGVDII